MVEVIDEVGEYGVQCLGFVGEGDIGEVVFTVACCSVGEETDGDEVW